MRDRSSWVRRTLVICFLAALLLLLLRWSSNSGPVVPTAPGGMPGTAEPDSSVSRRQKADESKASTAGELERSLHIWLRSLHEARRVLDVPPVPFDAIWPTREDARWDLSQFEGLQTPAALRELTAPQYEFHRPGPLFSAARIEGFAGGEAPDLSTPEMALLSMYATWVSGEEAWFNEWEAFRDAHVPEGESWSSITSEERARIAALDERPVEHFGSLNAMAMEVLGRWPEHPVADHAILATMRAAIPKLGPRWDESEIADLLLSIESDAVQEYAAVWLTRERFEPFTPTLPVLLDAFERVEASSLQNELRMSTWALNRAVALKDWDRASMWANRLRTGLDAGCRVSEPDRRLGCETREYELREAIGRLAAMGLATPSTWEEALAAEAWRCHLGAAPQVGISRTIAKWDGARWFFGVWDAPTDVTSCLEAVYRTEVVPGEPLSVRLTIEGR